MGDNIMSEYTTKQLSKKVTKDFKLIMDAQTIKMREVWDNKEDKR